MSNVPNSQFDILQWTDDEVTQVQHHREQVFSSEGAQDHAARLTPEQLAYVYSRHEAINSIVQRKFQKKLEDRGLADEFAKVLILPGLSPDSKPQYSEAGVAWFREKAPDLADEFVAYQEWRAGRAEVWKEEWKRLQEQASKDE